VIKNKINNFSWDIEELWFFNIDLIKNDVINFDQEWFLDTSRQEIEEAHKQTMMYQLRYFNYSWKKGQLAEYKDVNHLKTQGAIDQLNIIYKKLEEMFDGFVVRSELINMFKNSSISKHVDGGDMLRICRRVHIPIITNDNVWFTVLEKTINMKEGHCYEINNYAPHSVENNSNFDRVHLIIDILPSKHFKNKNI
jgi:hypothetical protein